MAFASPVSFTAPAIADRTISLPENTAADGTVHFAVTATSEDDGTPVAIASYMLVNDSNVAVTEYRGFTIDADSGDITLTGALDYEDANADGTIISLRVRATDDNGETASITLTVNVGDVNDNDPVFTTTGQALTAEIAESRTATDGTILTVVASDADGTALNNTVRYEITGGTGMGMFFIDPVTGDIRVADGVTLDYDTDPVTTSYTLIIAASDGGDNPPADAMTGTKDVTITLTNVNDIVPVAMQEGANNCGSLTETLGYASAPANVGTDYTITIDDAETNNAFRFTFEIEGVPASGVFDFIETSVGSGIYELTLLADQRIDRDSLDFANLEVGYKINDDVNESSNYIVSVITENSVGALTGITFTITDADSVGTLQYNEVVATTPNDNNNEIAGMFEVDTESGALRLQDGMALDREYPALRISGEIGLTITASDDLANSDPIEVIITVNDLNDATPIFKEGVATEVTFRETETKDAIVIDANRFVDGDATTARQSLEYSLTGDTGGFFRLDRNTGEVTITKEIDFEYPSIGMLTDGSNRKGFVITLRADAGDVLTEDQEITVVIEDVDDEDPTASPLRGSANIAEIAGSGVAPAGGKDANFVIAVTDPDTASGFTFDFTGTTELEQELTPKFDFFQVGNEWFLRLKER